MRLSLLFLSAAVGDGRYKGVVDEDGATYHVTQFWMKEQHIRLPFRSGGGRGSSKVAVGGRLLASKSTYIKGDQRSSDSLLGCLGRYDGRQMMEVIVGGGASDVNLRGSDTSQWMFLYDTRRKRLVLAPLPSGGAEGAVG